jgi:hypothetical protein
MLMNKEIGPLSKFNLKIWLMLVDREVVPISKFNLKFWLR